MNETVREFFDLIRADDIFGLTGMIVQDASLADAVNENGVCALMVATYQGRKEVVQLLLQSGSKVDAFTAAALGDTKRLARLVSENKPVLEQHSADGWTPLHLAAFFGQKDAVKLLLEAGARVDARSVNYMNNHPLHAAAAGRSRDLVGMLLEHGADVNATQAGGWTALHSAAQSGDVEMVKVLLANGAHADVRAENGQSPLDLAMGKGAQPVVDLLMDAPGIQ
ncbi:MAG: ankyrin repeat domain-containing protein [Acidobacteria bacterium]|nr:ankyrin repeat domain-containing protein [Acidobacteriota bacterium]